MALIWKDRVLETSTTTGTGAFTLAGAVSGYRTFASVMSTSDTCYYYIEAVDSNGVPTGDWETGLGTYSGTNTLARTTTIDSSNSGSAVSFSAGTKRVAVALTAAKAQPSLWGFNNPAASSFTLQSADATNLTLSNDADVGILIDPGAVGSAATRIAYRQLTDKTQAWDMVMRGRSIMPTTNFSSFGLIAYDSTGLKNYTVRVGNDNATVVAHYSNLTTYVATDASIALPSQFFLEWLRISFDGTNLSFYTSADGKMWLNLVSVAYTAYLGVQPNRVGFYLGVARTTGFKCVASVNYFSLTGPGV